MTIISQDYELINFDKLAKVTMYEGEVDGTTVYAIVGFESASSDDAEISGDSDTVPGFERFNESKQYIFALSRIVINAENSIAVAANLSII